ncbi:hypothetical protein Q7P37_001134 [Cladosporium fusiforme]
MSAMSLHQQFDSDAQLRRHRTRDTSSSARRRSPDQTKGIPSNQTVITSIISSLDAFDPSKDFPTENQQSRRVGSTTRSVSGSVASSPSIVRSNFMPRPETSAYGNILNGGSDWEYLNESDAAPPPVIPASPSVSTLSHSSLRPRPSIRSGESRYTPSLHSLQRSPVSPKKESLYPASKNLSAESWIKLNIQQSLESAHARKVSSQTSRESGLRREESERQHLATYVAENSSRGRPISGEVHRKASPPPPSSRGRVFLDTDKADKKASGPPTPRSLSIRTKSNESYKDAFKQGSPSLGVSPQVSPRRRSPMADSIPLRTSSLRQSSSSPAPMKKKGKSSKRSHITSNPFRSKRKEAISDTSFLDLGEDDETVKRIMELRKKRQSRLNESRASAASDDIDILPLRANDLASGDKDDSTPRASARPPTNRSFTVPTKLSENLGMRADATLYDLDESPNLSATYIPESPLSATHYFEPLSPRSLPGTTTTSPQDSLDLSYAQAVHALHRARSGAPSSDDNPRPSIEAAMPNVPFRRGSNATSTSTSRAPSFRAPSLQQTRSQRESPSRFAHPDLPSNFGSKSSRRKSITESRYGSTIDERPQRERKDSVEDAVLGFLRAQRLNQKIRHVVSGRTISFSEVGDPKGSAVFVCVGMGLTRFVTAFYDELASLLKLRLVTIERPGVGDSDGYPPNDRSGPLNWPNDVLTVCDHLGIESFGLLAHSAGAVYALATALVLPHMVKGKVHLLAPWIPPSQMEVVSHSTASSTPAAVLPRSQRLLRVLPTPFLKAANSSFMASATASLNSANKRKPSGTGAWSPSPEQSDFPSSVQGAKRPTTSGGDRADFRRRESIMLMDQYMPSTNPMENFPIRGSEGRRDRSTSPNKRETALFLSATATPTDPAFTYASTALNAAEHAERERQTIYTSRLTQRTWEYAIRDSNPATDLLVCLERHRQVGFRYTDISAPVVITHGAQDKRVPVGNVRWLGDQMNLVAGPRKDLYAAVGGYEVGGGGCEVRVLEEEGHGLMASPAIMGDVLTEISGCAEGEEEEE